MQAKKRVHHLFTYRLQSDLQAPFPQEACTRWPLFSVSGRSALLLSFIALPYAIVAIIIRSSPAPCQSAIRCSPVKMVNMFLNLRKSTSIAGCALLILLSLSACTSCATTPCDGNNTPETSWQDPLYPGATNVSMAPVGNTDTRFTTPDSPESVLAFYHDTLTQIGWPKETMGTPTPNQTVATFSGYANCGAFSEVQVKTARIDNETHVSVRTLWWGCE